MTSIVLSFRNLPMKNKLLLAIVVLILLPMIVLSFFAYKQSEGVILAQTTALLSQHIEQATSRLEEIPDTVKGIVSVIQRDSRIIEILESDPTTNPPSHQIDDFRYIENLLVSLSVGNKVRNLRLYVPAGFMFSNELVSTSNLDEFKDSANYRQLIEHEAGIYYGKVQLETYLLQKPVSVLPVFFPIYSMKQKQTLLGVLRIDFLEQDLEDIVSDILFTEQGTATLTNPLQDTIIAEHIASPHVETPLIQMTKTIPVTRWELSVKIPTQSLLADSRNLRTQIILFATAVAVIVTLLAIWSSRRTVSRIQTLVENFKQVEQGNLDAIILVDAEDEIGILQYRFNQTVARLKEMMEETYQLGIDLKEMELISLQNQIKPHFLYNTLNMVYLATKEHGAEEASQIVSQLADYYRLSLNQGKIVVSLEEEIHHGTLYLDIENYRFENRIAFEIDIPEALLGTPLLRLTLQPILENAVHHGIMKREDKTGSIRISARTEGGDVILSIADTGVGMEKERADTILQEHLQPAAASGYGLWNIHRRMQVNFGEGYGLLIVSVPQKGTTVEIKVPCSSVEM